MVKFVGDDRAPQAIAYGHWSGKKRDCPIEILGLERAEPR
jgi:hypothetical protein